MTLVVLGSLFSATDVKAEPDLESIKQERSEVQEGIQKADKDIQAVEAELTDLQEEIDRFEESIEYNQNMLEETEDDILQSEEDVAILEDEIAVVEEEIEKRFEVIKQRAAALQKSGGSFSYLEVIFDSKSFGEFIDRVVLVSKIVEADSNLLSEHQQDEEILEKKQSKVEEKLTELTDMKTELEGMQVLVVEQKEQSDLLKEELQDKRQSNIALKSDLQLEDSNLASQESAILNRIQQAERSQSEIQTLSQESSRNNNSSSNTSSSASKPTSTQSVATSGNLSGIISASSRYFGNSTYRLGAGRSSSDIANGYFDCSGFVSWAFSQIGINIGASTSALSGTGQKVSVSEMKPGDLVFFNTYKTNGHVGIYVGGNKFLGSQSSTGVAYADMNNSYWKQRFTGHVRRIMN